MIIRVWLCGYAVDNIRYGEIPTDALNVVDGIWSKQPLQYTRHKINHDDTALLPEHHSKLAKDFHALRIYH